MTPRLIEKWLPIAALGEESVRERRASSALPPLYYFHVWWARRPLVASRAAVLGSLLPADADKEKFLHTLGIHGDPIATRRRIEQARKKGDRFEGEAYSYPRAFTYCPSPEDLKWIAENSSSAVGSGPVLLDPTSGGGSIPFESLRLGINTYANDLNPVASLILRATLQFPVEQGIHIHARYEKLVKQFVGRRDSRLKQIFPDEPESDCVATNYIWARTIKCPYCEGVIPLSPNWNLAPGGLGIRIIAQQNTRTCSFELVKKAGAQSEGTISDGDAKCPFSGCGRVVDGTVIKRQAQEGEMGDQLFAIAFKRRIESRTKSGLKKVKWERGYRAAIATDDNIKDVQSKLEAKEPEWDALDIIPTESISQPSNYDRGHRLYGMLRWRDLFSPRQLYGHATGVEVFRELLSEAEQAGQLDDCGRGAFVLLAFALDKMLNWNSRLSGWNVNYERMRSVFDTHGFKMVWSYAEMPPLAGVNGEDWTFEQTGKAYRELVELATSNPASSTQDSLFASRRNTPKIIVTNKSADSLEHIQDGTVDVIVMDPPYYDNVMYAELSDFFYVWLKRTAGHVFPDEFRRRLADKDAEAVANIARFAGTKAPKQAAFRDYREKMQAIFAECRRTLKADGVLTLMFTHKAIGAWDALTSGLLDAGFTITATWPVNTEFENALGIRTKAAANSTIFLVCRPRLERKHDVNAYWEDIEPRVAEAVRARIDEFEKAGIKGVDLYLSCFGPALEKFAEHWPIKRGQPRLTSAQTGRQRKNDEDSIVDPYVVTPEDALDAARREVKKWKLDKLLRTHRKAELDPLTEWFVLAWDAFKAPEFPYDEALRLARVVGIDLDHDVLGKVAEKKSSDVILWDSAKRAAKSALGSPDGSRALIDALHHAAHRGRTQGVEAARELLTVSGAEHRPGFAAALAAVLEVLPVSSTFTHIADEAGPVAEAASDFDALEHLRRLAFSEKVARPQQLEMWSTTPQ